MTPPGLGGGDGNGDNGGGGLGPGAITGISLAGVGVLLFALLLVFRKEKEADEDAEGDDDLEQMSAQGNAKELLAITADGELDPNAPRALESPDATGSMTASDVSSIPSTSTRGNDNGNASEYYATNNLLPGRPDDESMLSSSDGPSFFSTEESTINDADEGVEVMAGDKRSALGASEYTHL